MPWTKADLRRAETHLKRAWEMVARQEKIVHELGLNGHSTKDAEELLRLMRESLKVFRRHRNTIEREMK
jgi:hypothetical protein